MAQHKIVKDMHAIPHMLRNEKSFFVPENVFIIR